MTNYEKIKNMTVEEMAVIIMCPNSCFDDALEDCPIDTSCTDCTRAWLESEVTE